MRAPLWLALSGTMLAGAAPGLAYSPAQVKWPGTIKGTIKLVGAVAPLPAVQAPEEANACARELADDSLQATQDGRLSQVVVFIDGITSGKDLPRRALTLDLRGCRVAPHVMTAGIGDEIGVGNTDNLFHALTLSFHPKEAAPARSTQYLGLPAQSQRVKWKVTQPGFLVAHGELNHPWLRGVVRTFDHPYHTTTGSDGAFEIRDLPAGTYTVVAWHERLGTVNKVVELKAGYVIRADMEFSAATANPTPWTMTPVNRLAPRLAAALEAPPPSAAPAPGGKAGARVPAPALVPAPAVPVVAPPPGAAPAVAAGASSRPTAAAAPLAAASRPAVASSRAPSASAAAPTSASRVPWAASAPVAASRPAQSASRAPTAASAPVAASRPAQSASRAPTAASAPVPASRPGTGAAGAGGTASGGPRPAASGARPAPASR